MEQHAPKEKAGRPIAGYPAFLVGLACDASV